MKICAACGNELDDNAKFCGVCGTDCCDIPESGGDYSENKKKSFPIWKMIVFGILTVCLVIGIIFGIVHLRWYFSTEQEILRAVNGGDYDKALSLMDEDLEDNDDLIKGLSDRIAYLKNSFTDKSLSYSVVTTELDSIMELNVDGMDRKIEETRSYIDSLNESRGNFTKAEGYVASGNYAEAITYYQKVSYDDPDYETVKSKLQEATNKYREGILQDAEKFATEGLYTNAIDVLNSSVDVIPNDQAVAERIAQYEASIVQQKKTDAINRAKEFEQEGDYLSAYQAIERIDGYASDPEMLSLRNQYYNGYVEKVLEEAKAFADEGLYTYAIDVLNHSLEKIPGDQTILDQIAQYEKSIQQQNKNNLINKAKEYAEKGEYLSAFREIEKQEGYSLDAELLSLYNQYHSKYVEGILQEADALVAEKKHMDAISLLEKALKVAPNNDALQNKLDEVEKNKPVLLNSLIEIYGDFRWNNVTPIDPFGNDYSESDNYIVFFDDYQGKYYVEYRIYGEYQTLEFELAPYIEMYGWASVSIYSDGTKIFETPSIDRKMDPTKYEVDVTGLEYIEIRIVVSSSKNGCLILKNARLWK